MYLYNPVTYLAGGSQNIPRLLTLFHHAKNDSANMHKACGLKVTQQTYTSLGGCMTLFDFLIQTVKLQHLFTFLRLPIPNRTSIQMFSLLNWRLIIRSFGRHVIKTGMFCLVCKNAHRCLIPTNGDNICLN